MSTSITIRRYLDTQDAHFSMVAMPWDAQGKWRAEARDIDPASIARPVILKDDRGLLMVVVPLTHRLNLTALNQQLGRQLVTADKTDYRDIFTDCSGKLLPALGEAYGLETVVNNALLDLDTVLIASGNAEELIRLSGLDFQRLNQGAQFGSDFSAVPARKPATATAAVSATSETPSNVKPIKPVAVTETTVQTEATAEDDTTPRPDIRQRIQHTTKLPGMPSLAYKIIQLNANPYAHAEDLAKLVEKDPSLTAQIVRYAQSPFYGYQGKVASVRQAISRVLGYDMVMNIALGVAAARPFRIPASGPLGLNEYWRHSTYCAALTQALCNLVPREKRPRPGTAYLCGLLHNFGFLLLGHLFPKEFKILQDAIREQPDTPIVDLERDTLGITHMEIGMWLMENWSMPAEVISVIQQHHNWNYDETNANYAHLVHVSNCLLRSHGMGDEPDSDIPAHILDYLETDTDKIWKVLERTIESSEDLDIMARQLVA